MNPPVISKNALAGILIMSVLILAFMLVAQLADRRIKVVFCDVGQGNVVYIRLQDIDILIDTGPPNGSILACLGTHMPFFDRTIEYLAISHPQNDHDGSALEITKRYAVKNIVAAAVFQHNLRIVQLRKAAPSARFIMVKNSMEIPLPRHAKINFLAASSLKPLPDDNDRSLIVSFSTIGSQYLFTGDISATILSSLTITKNKNNLILLVPHHGSAHGLSGYFLRKAHPRLAIISVGKKNPYGHPSRHSLDLLEKNKVPYRRTDKEGTIVVTE